MDSVAIVTLDNDVIAKIPKISDPINTGNYSSDSSLQKAP